MEDVGQCIYFSLYQSPLLFLLPSFYYNKIIFNYAIMLYCNKMLHHYYSARKKTTYFITGVTDGRLSIVSLMTGQPQENKMLQSQEE